MATLTEVLPVGAPAAADAIPASGTIWTGISDDDSGVPVVTIYRNADAVLRVAVYDSPESQVPA